MGNCLLGGMSDPDAVTKVITSNGGIMEFNAPVAASFIADEFPGHAIFPSQDLFWKPLSQFDELEAGKSYYLLPLNNQPEQHPPAAAAAASSLIVRQGHVRSLSVPTTPHPPPYRMSLDYQHHQGVGLLKRTSKEHYSCRTSNSKSRLRLSARGFHLVRYGEDSTGNSSKNTSKGRLRLSARGSHLPESGEGNTGNSSKTTRTSTNSGNGSSSSCRFWKVKLAITPEQLMEILSQEASTKELMESVRIVAKCGVATTATSGCGISSVTSAAASMVSEEWSLSSSGRSVNSSKIDALVVDI